MKLQPRRALLVTDSHELLESVKIIENSSGVVNENSVKSSPKVVDSTENQKGKPGKPGKPAFHHELTEDVNMGKANCREIDLRCYMALAPY